MNGAADNAGRLDQHGLHPSVRDVAALRALAFRWIRILYRCSQDRTPYDESTCLNALKRRGLPLLNSIAASP